MKKLLHSFLHTYFGISWPWIWLLHNSHNNITEPLEMGSLIGLGQKNTSHVPRGTPFNRHVSFLDTVSHKKIPHINILGPFPTGCLAILLNNNSALVFLVNDVVGHIIALWLQEQPCPQNGQHTVAHTYHLRFGGVMGIKLLFRRSRYRITSAHTESATCVASHVGVHTVWPIDHPLQKSRSIGTHY